MDAEKARYMLDKEDVRRHVSSIVEGKLQSMHAEYLVAIYALDVAYGEIARLNKEVAKLNEMLKSYEERDEKIRKGLV